MKAGEAVEVEKVIASHPRQLLKRWCGGYAFVSTAGGITTVKHTAGLYEGLFALYPSSAVRAVGT